ncbi:hypothetical protein COB52_05675, partial [Candidatus Kaiserbacteria bacterium]
MKSEELKKNANDQPQTKEEKVKRVVESGAIYITEVDQNEVRVESALFSPPDLIAAAGLDPTAHVLIQIFKDGTEKKLNDTDSINLCQYGIEKFRTEKILVPICIDDKEYQVKPGKISVK